MKHNIFENPERSRENSKRSSKGHASRCLVSEFRVHLLYMYNLYMYTNVAYELFHDKFNTKNSKTRQARADDMSKISQFFKKSKNVNILKFGDYIWNHHEECIQISTNMPSIGSIMCEIGFEIEKRKNSSAR